MTRLWRQVLGETIRSERRRRGQRLVDTAATAGISPQYLSEIERGRKEPSSEMVEAVAGALAMTVLDLVRRAAGVDPVEVVDLVGLVEPAQVLTVETSGPAPGPVDGGVAGSVVALAA